MSNGDGARRSADDDSDRPLPSLKNSTLPVAGDELDSGERRLNELGYKQELRREMVPFSSRTPGSIGLRPLLVTSSPVP